MRLSGDARTLWETACGLNRGAAAVMPGAARLPPLIFMTDPERTPRPWETAACLPPGAGVIYRAFGRADALETGERLAEAARQTGVVLLVGEDEALAEAIEAHGLHLPQRGLERAAALRDAHPGWLLTGAVHDADAIRRGAAGGLDALVLSPVFAPGGISTGEPLGIEGFRAMAPVEDRPVYALGGITAANAGELARSGACGLCAVSGVMDAFN